MMMNCRNQPWIVMLIGMVFPMILMAQQQEGSIQIIQDQAIEGVVEKHKTVNQNRSGFPGFRIQIFFDSGAQSKVKAMRVSRAFHQAYPDKGIYLTFDSPNYKVRVGDFPNRLDAFRFLMHILPEYPNAYIVREKIKIHTSNPMSSSVETNPSGTEPSTESSTL